MAKIGGGKYRSNYLKRRDYHINYSRAHWPQYYLEHRKEILKQKRTYYKLNRAGILERDRKYNIRNRKHKKEYNKSYRLKNLDRLRNRDRNYYWQNIEKIRKYRTANALKIKLTRIEYKNRIRNETLTKYSTARPRCAICGEKDPRLLTLDHINDNGAEERKRLAKKGGVEFYVWLKRNGFPPGYQVLCYNCNWLKRYKNTDTVRSRYSRKVKFAVLSHYADYDNVLRCVQCGEDRIELLTIDHINGGGHKEQERLGLKGTEYYRYLIKKGYPTGLRILCMNCNVSNSRPGNIVKNVARVII